MSLRIIYKPNHNSTVKISLYYDALKKFCISSLYLFLNTIDVLLLEMYPQERFTVTLLLSGFDTSVLLIML